MASRTTTNPPTTVRTSTAPLGSLRREVARLWPGGFHVAAAPDGHDVHGDAITLYTVTLYTAAGAEPFYAEDPADVLAEVRAWVEANGAARS